MFDSRPQSAYLSNMRLSELSTAELFVIFSVRLWVFSRWHPDSALPEWQQGFARAGTETSGAVGFDTLLRIVMVSTTRDLDFREPHAGHLGADEALLLRLVALLQCNRTTEALVILSVWLPAAAARMAIAPAGAFANALAARALSIPCRSTDVSARHLPPPFAQATFASNLVH